MSSGQTENSNENVDGITILWYSLLWNIYFKFDKIYSFLWNIYFKFDKFYSFLWNIYSKFDKFLRIKKNIALVNIFHFFLLSISCLRRIAIWYLSPCVLSFELFIAQSNNGPLARKYKITMIVMGSLLLALITAFIVILALYIKGLYARNQYLSCLSHWDWTGSFF